MKICHTCGAENKDEAVFCTSCGAPLEDAEPAVEKEKKERKSRNDQDGGKNASRRDAFVDPEEQVIASIGSSYIQNFLANRAVKRSVGILTQKRFYYKGRNFSGIGKDMSSATEEGVVPIENISFTKIVYTRKIGLLIMGLFIMLLSVFVPQLSDLLMGEGRVSTDLIWIIMAAMIAVAICLLVGYYMSRQTLFVIHFSDGSFGFDVRFYSINEIREFQRQLHVVKDQIVRCETRE